MNDTNTTVAPLKVGDIFDMSWGFDQTNVNFFQVTRVTPKGVYVREIGYKGAGGEGFMCQNVVATPNVFLQRSQWCGDGNTETLRKVGRIDGRPYLSFGRSYCAFRWDGKPTYNSWYA